MATFEVQRGRISPDLILPLVIGFAICVVDTAVADPARYVKDFEDGIIEYVSGNAPTITESPRRRGRFAMKSVLNRATSPISYRTELQFYRSLEIRPGQEYWYGFSIYLPDTYVSDPIWEIVAQWHSSPDPAERNGGLNPPVALMTNNGIWTVLTRWDSNPVTVSTNYEGSARYNLGSYETGRWTDWVFRIKWSPYQDGYLQVWKNGEQVVSKVGPIGYNDAVGPYFKMGIYKGWKDRYQPVGVVSERILYHDELRITDATGSYADVAPGEAALPLPPSHVTVE